MGKVAALMVVIAVLMSASLSAAIVAGETREALDGSIAGGDSFTPSDLNKPEYIYDEGGEETAYEEANTDRHDFAYYYLDNARGQVMALLARDLTYDLTVPGEGGGSGQSKTRILEYYKYNAFGSVTVLPVYDRDDTVDSNVSSIGVYAGGDDSIPGSGSRGEWDLIENTPLTLSDNNILMMNRRTGENGHLAVGNSYGRNGGYENQYQSPPGGSTPAGGEAPEKRKPEIGTGGSDDGGKTKTPETGDKKAEGSKSGASEEDPDAESVPIDYDDVYTDKLKGENDGRVLAKFPPSKWESEILAQKRCKCIKEITVKYYNCCPKLKDEFEGGEYDAIGEGHFASAIGLYMQCCIKLKFVKADDLDCTKQKKLNDIPSGTGCVVNVIFSPRADSGVALPTVGMGAHGTQSAIVVCPTADEGIDDHVLAHEIGHAAGLDHGSEDGKSKGDARKKNEIMNGTPGGVARNLGEEKQWRFTKPDCAKLRSFACPCKKEEAPASAK